MTVAAATDPRNPCLSLGVPSTGVATLSCSAKLAADTGPVDPEAGHLSRHIVLLKVMQPGGIDQLISGDYGGAEVLGDLM
jgi:hypothetical protein